MSKEEGVAKLPAHGSAVSNKRYPDEHSPQNRGDGDDTTSVAFAGLFRNANGKSSKIRRLTLEFSSSGEESDANEKHRRKGKNSEIIDLSRSSSESPRSSQAPKQDSNVVNLLEDDDDDEEVDDDNVVSLVASCPKDAGSNKPSPSSAEKKKQTTMDKFASSPSRKSPNKKQTTLDDFPSKPSPSRKSVGRKAGDTIDLTGDDSDSPTRVTVRKKLKALTATKTSQLKAAPQAAAVAESRNLKPAPQAVAATKTSQLKAAPQAAAAAESRNLKPAPQAVAATKNSQLKAAPQAVAAAAGRNLKAAPQAADAPSLARMTSHRRIFIDSDSSDSSDDDAMRGPFKRAPKVDSDSRSPSDASASSSGTGSSSSRSCIKPRKLFQAGNTDNDDRKPAPAAAPASASSSYDPFAKWRVADDESPEAITERMDRVISDGKIPAAAPAEMGVADDESLDAVMQKFHKQIKHVNHALSYEEFRDLFRASCDSFLQEQVERKVEDLDDEGLRTDFLDVWEQLGRCPLKNANRKMDKHDSTKQRSAMYGRILFPTLEVIMKEIMDLTSDHLFVDIGQGAGNAPLQAAYTVGCEARGIEIDDSRHTIAVLLDETLRSRYESMVQKDNKRYTVGKTDLRKGDFTDPRNRRFIIEGDVVLCNNYNEVFGDKSAKGVKQVLLDEQLAGLFCLMKPGAIFVTMWPLNLPPSRAEAENYLEKNNLEVQGDESFFDHDTFNLQGPERLMSWNKENKSIMVHRYTRRRQGSTFRCLDKRCGKVNRAWRCANPDCPKDNPSRCEKECMILPKLCCDCGVQTPIRALRQSPEEIAVPDDLFYLTKER